MLSYLSQDNLPPFVQEMFAGATGNRKKETEIIMAAVSKKEGKS
jgi:hypothetical protein